MTKRNIHNISKIYGGMPVGWAGSYAMLLASVTFNGADIKRLDCPAFIRHLSDTVLPPGHLILLFFIHSPSGRIILSSISHSKVKEKYYSRSQFEFFQLMDSR